jgi:hypothetical protein
MFPWGKGLRSFGWQCKKCKQWKGGGVQLYECENCGPDPESEYCLSCASRMKCPFCGGNLIKG